MKPKQVNETSNTSDDTSNLHDEQTISTQQSSLNFSTGVSAECLTVLDGNQQLMEASKRIKRKKAHGEDLTNRLKEAKRITAGFVWKEDTNCLGETVFEVCKEKYKRKKEETKRKGRLL